MKIAAFIAIALLFIPIKCVVAINQKNEKVEGVIRLILLFAIPIQIKLYNLRGKPFTMRICTFGKAKDFHTLAKTNRINGLKAMESKRNIFFIKVAGKYIKELELKFSIGIKDRADYAAIINYSLAGLAAFSLSAWGVEHYKIFPEPKYNADTVETALKCIFSINLVNIIYEVIKEKR